MTSYACKTEQILPQAVQSATTDKAQIFGAKIPTQIGTEGTENKNDLRAQYDRSTLF